MKFVENSLSERSRVIIQHFELRVVRQYGVYGLVKHTGRQLQQYSSLGDTRRSTRGSGQPTSMITAGLFCAFDLSTRYILTFAMLVRNAVDVQTEHDLGFAMPREACRLGQEGRRHGEDVTESSQPATNGQSGEQAQTALVCFNCVALLLVRRAMRRDYQRRPVFRVRQGLFRSCYVSFKMLSGQSRGQTAVSSNLAA